MKIFHSYKLITVIFTARIPIVQIKKNLYFAISTSQNGYIVLLRKIFPFPPDYTLVLSQFALKIMLEYRSISEQGVKSNLWHL